MKSKIPMQCLCIVLIVCAGCEQRIRPSVVDGFAGDEMPAQESWKSRIIISKEGVVSAIIDAGYIALYPEKKRTYLEEGVKVDFLDPDGSVTSTLTSVRGEVDEEKNDLSAFGNVIVESDDGTVLVTEELYYEDASGQVHTEAYVEITSPDELIQGYGLVSDAGLKNYTIYRVTGQTKPELR